jgi:hypothetical protein
MRSPEQINNLRKIISIMVSPSINFLLTDTDVDRIADSLQNKINFLYTNWELRIKGKWNCKLSWKEIEPEPKYPCCSLNEITAKCYDLLLKYPKIFAIEVTNYADKKDKHIISR